MSEAEFIERHLAESRGMPPLLPAHGFFNIEKRGERFIPNLPRNLSRPGCRDRVPGVGSFQTAEEAARARGAYLYSLQQQRDQQQREWKQPEHVSQPYVSQCVSDAQQRASLVITCEK